jgi:serine/threonine protein kinase
LGFVGKLSLDVSRAYAAQIVALLYYMQVRRISHRDMKPHNLMLDDNWNIKLVRFRFQINFPLD